MSRVRVGQVRRTKEGNEATIIRVEGDAVKVHEVSVYASEEVEEWPVIRKSLLEIHEETVRAKYGGNGER